MVIMFRVWIQSLSGNWNVQFSRNQSILLKAMLVKTIYDQSFKSHDLYWKYILIFLNLLELFRN